MKDIAHESAAGWKNGNSTKYYEENNLPKQIFF